MTTFFNVDVETSALTPWDGYLLTVGIQPVHYTPGLGAAMGEERFYVRIDRNDELAASGWWDGQGTDTFRWWCDQSAEAQDEAWRDGGLVRHEPETAALMLVEFVNGVEADPKERIFVANPVAFDKMWVDELFASTGITNPFHYQSLCLRSMKFGLREKSPWGGTRDNHEPKVPHHAFHDAHAQALDLLTMIAERDGTGGQVAMVSAGAAAGSAQVS